MFVVGSFVLFLISCVNKSCFGVPIRHSRLTRRSAFDILPEDGRPAADWWNVFLVCFGSVSRLYRHSISRLLGQDWAGFNLRPDMNVSSLSQG